MTDSVPYTPFSALYSPVNRRLHRPARHPWRRKRTKIAPIIRKKATVSRPCSSCQGEKVTLTSGSATATMKRRIRVSILLAITIGASGRSIVVEVSHCLIHVLLSCRCIGRRRSTIFEQGRKISLGCLASLQSRLKTKEWKKSRPHVRVSTNQGDGARAGVRERELLLIRWGGPS